MTQGRWHPHAGEGRRPLVGVPEPSRRTCGRGHCSTFGAVPLSPIDRLEIFELPARYADALDLLEPEQLRSVFTDDAVWEVVGGRRLVGISEIMEFMGRPDVHPGAHLMTNVYVGSVDDDGTGDPVVHLRSRGVFPVGPSDPKNPTTVFYGRYDDEVIRTGDGWRIRHRRYRFGS
jgi:hypothetical protein